MEQVLKLMYDVKQMQKGLLNLKTNKKNKIQLWKNYAKQNHLLSVEILEEIKNGDNKRRRQQI
jgi:hypothetical protein|tara:strand:- start:480 stop:668 length:189 start_codon:yes stop_codon:yes gene_type:complete